MPLKPIGDRVMLRRIEQATQSPGGIIIPDAAKKKSTRATVVAVGTGKAADTLKVGDVVVLPNLDGGDIEIDGEKFIVIPAEIPLAVEIP